MYIYIIIYITYIPKTQYSRVCATLYNHVWAHCHCHNLWGGVSTYHTVSTELHNIGITDILLSSWSTSLVATNHGCPVAANWCEGESGAGRRRVTSDRWYSPQT